MKHVALAAVLVLASSGCVSFIDPIDEEPCQTLKCVKRVEYRKCMSAFARASMDRGFVVVWPDDDFIYQDGVCRAKVKRIRVY